MFLLALEDIWHPYYEKILKNRAANPHSPPMLPLVLEETARIVRHRLTEEITRLREDLNGVQLRVKSLKSQVARLGKPDASREAELREQIGAGEVRAAELKREILVRERGRVAGDELRKTMEPFDARKQNLERLGD